MAPIAAAQETQHPTRNGLPIWAVSISKPQQFSVTAGYVFAFPGEELDVTRHGVFGTGLLTEAEVGTAGGKLGVGLYASAGGFASASARVVAMRTWGDPWGTSPNETFAGPELSASFFLFRLTTGYLFPVTNGADGTWLIGVGVGR